MTRAVAFETIAAELYSGPLDTFVARRNARASEEEDRSVAARIRALRKPTVAAWIIDVFASERGEELNGALQLAGELQEAQAELDAGALSQLGRERRALTNRLAAEAAALARARGGRVTEATIETVRQTLSAAFFDPDAASAVASGRLTHDLEPSSSFPIDMDAVVGGGAPSPQQTPEMRVDEVSERRERRRAEKALHDAEQAHARAERDHATAEREIRDADRRAEAAEQRIAALDAEIRRLRRESASARDESAAATARRDRAARRLEDAANDVDKARRDLEALRDLRNG